MWQRPVRVCVFLDGGKLRHSIRGLFRGDFDSRDYLPKMARWSSLFEKIVDDATDHNGALIRTYWNVIQHLDFFPFWFPNSDRELVKLTSLLSKDRDIA